MKKFFFLIAIIVSLCWNVTAHAQCPDTYEPANNNKSASNQVLTNQTFFVSKLSSGSDIDYWKYEQIRPNGSCIGIWKHILFVDPMGNSIKIDIINSSNNTVHSSGIYNFAQSITLPYGAYHLKVYKSVTVTTNHCYRLYRSFDCEPKDIPNTN